MNANRLTYYRYCCTHMEIHVLYTYGDICAVHVWRYICEGRPIRVATTQNKRAENIPPGHAKSPLLLQLQQPSVKYAACRGGRWVCHLEKHARESDGPESCVPSAVRMCVARRVLHRTQRAALICVASAHHDGGTRWK